MAAPQSEDLGIGKIFFSLRQKIPIGILKGGIVSKKKKFDLTALVHQGHLKDGQSLIFLSDPSKQAKVAKQPNGEFKLKVGAEVLTVHAFAQRCLGQEPPDHAARWLRTDAGKTLYELWHLDEEEMLQAA
jgi:hypothetical protein